MQKVESLTAYNNNYSGIKSLELKNIEPLTLKVHEFGLFIFEKLIVSNAFNEIFPEFKLLFNFKSEESEAFNAYFSNKTDVIAKNRTIQILHVSHFFKHFESIVKKILNNEKIEEFNDLIRFTAISNPIRDVNTFNLKVNELNSLMYSLGFKIVEGCADIKGGGYSDIKIIFEYIYNLDFPIRFEIQFNTQEMLDTKLSDTYEERKDLANKINRLIQLLVVKKQKFIEVNYSNSLDIIRPQKKIQLKLLPLQLPVSEFGDYITEEIIKKDITNRQEIMKHIKNYLEKICSIKPEASYIYVKLCAQMYEFYELLKINADLFENIVPIFESEEGRSKINLNFQEIISLNMLNSSAIKIPELTYS